MESLSNSIKLISKLKTERELRGETTVADRNGSIDARPEVPDNFASLEEKHPFIRSTPEPPNQGKDVTDVSELLTKKTNYDEILTSYGIKSKRLIIQLSPELLKLSTPIQIEKKELTYVVPDVVIEQSWTILDIIQKKPPSSWISLFREAHSDIVTISEFIQAQESTIGAVIPYKKDIFRAQELCKLESVCLVILGQDPYYNIVKGSYVANGIAFSVNRGVAVPKSLENVFKVLHKTVPGFEMPGHGDLTKWVEQGVLLLNTSLTVMPDSPNAHKGIWASYTTKLLHKIAQVNPQCVYMLWGGEAQAYDKIITSKNILFTSHPSPLGAYRGFMACNHFNEANEMLVKQGRKPINWNLD